MFAVLGRELNRQGLLHGTETVAEVKRPIRQHNIREVQDRVARQSNDRRHSGRQAVVQVVAADCSKQRCHKTVCVEPGPARV